MRSNSWSRKQKEQEEEILKISAGMSEHLRSTFL